jgi:hypothetical protein
MLPMQDLLNYIFILVGMETLMINPIITLVTCSEFTMHSFDMIFHLRDMSQIFTPAKFK